MKEDKKTTIGCVTVFILFIALLWGLMHIEKVAEDTQKADEQAEKDSIGLFVYLDRDSTLHIRHHCYGLRLRDDGAVRYSSVTRVRIDTLHSIRECCPRCVSDAAYENLEKIINKNNQ